MWRWKRYHLSSIAFPLNWNLSLEFILFIPVWPRFFVSCFLRRFLWFDSRQNKKWLLEGGRLISLVTFVEDSFHYSLCGDWKIAFRISLIIIIRFRRAPHLVIRGKYNVNQSHTWELDALLVRKAIVTVETTVPHPHIRSVNVAVWDWSLTHATLEAVNVVEQTEVFDNHRSPWSQLMIAIRT